MTTDLEHKSVCEAYKFVGKHIYVFNPLILYTLKFSLNCSIVSCHLSDVRTM